MSRSTARFAPWSLVGCAVVVAACAVNLWTPHPVSMGALPEGSGVAAVRSGEVYLSEADTSAPQQFRLSLLTPRGELRELFRQPPDAGRASLAAVAEGTAFVVVSPSVPAAVSNGAQRPDGGVGRLPHRSGRVLRAISLATGAADEVVHDPGIGRVAVLRDACYWLRAAPDGPRIDLMVTQRRGGPTRRLVKGWRGEAYPSLQAGASGLYWIVERREPTRYRRLMHLDPDGGGIRVVEGFTGPTVPAESGGRLFWLEANPHGALAGIIQRIVSARPDGSDRETVLDLAGAAGALQTLSWLAAHRGELYAVLIETPRETDRPPRSTFCRIRPGGRPALQRLCRLPPRVEGQGFLDDDWDHFQAWDLRESWLDSGTGPPGLSSTRVLHRFPLPRPDAPGVAGLPLAPQPYFLQEPRAGCRSGLDLPVGLR